MVATVILLSLLKPSMSNLSFFNSLKISNETIYGSNIKWHSFEEGLTL
jgi:hypothetical protein